MSKTTKKEQKCGPAGIHPPHNVRGEKRDTEEERERRWIDGNRAAYKSILREAIRGLLGDGAKREDVAGAIAIAELEDVRGKLREVCEVHGDNDWSDNLALDDVIEKHLASHLDDLVEDVAAAERVNIIRFLEQQGSPAVLAPIIDTIRKGNYRS